jgi:DMSO/TMAO reductase YedYZ molybdopterin-dependent catalytic subunit
MRTRSPAAMLASPDPVPVVKLSTPATRRHFLELLTGATIAPGLAPLLRGLAHAGSAAGGEAKVLATVPFVDEGNFPLETTVGAGLGRRRALDLATLSPATPVVPQDRFFIRTGRPDRLPPAASWKVRAHGLVAAPVEIAIEELEKQAVPVGTHLIECAGNSRGAHFGLISVAEWTGVPLARVLDRVRPARGATQVLVSGFDEHGAPEPLSEPGASWIFGLDEIRESGAFLATRMNGAPLDPDHGHPLRLVVPGWYGCTAIKWVNEIALLDDEAPATGQMREYAGRTHQDAVGPRDEELIQAGGRPEGPPLARDFWPATIDPAALPIRVEKVAVAGGGVSYRILGVRWGGKGVSPALGIRLGEQLDLAPVEESPGGSPGGWSFWSYTFRPKAPGRYRIDLAPRDPSVRTRRLDMRYYAREIEIDRVS